MKISLGSLTWTAGFIFTGLALMSGSATHAAPVPPAAAPQTAWGEVRNGLQLGIRFPSGMNAFRRGDVLAVQVVVRNVSPEPRQLDFRSPTAWEFTVAERRQVRVRAEDETTGHAYFAPLRLPPGGEEVVPGPGPAAALREKNWKGDVEDYAIPTLRLRPGTYSIQAPRPILLLENGTEQRKDVLATGKLEFRVLPDPSQESAVLAAHRIAWGEVEDGLQSGLALSDPSERYRVGEGVAFNLYVRNRGNAARAVHHVRERDLDYVPAVMNAGGETISVSHVWISGLRDTMERTLKPGERSLVAHPQLELVAQPQERPGLVPTVAVAPGSYRVSQSFVYRRGATSQDWGRLASGELTFGVEAEQHK